MGYPALVNNSTTFMRKVYDFFPKANSQPLLGTSRRRPGTGPDLTFRPTLRRPSVADKMVNGGRGPARSKLSAIVKCKAYAKGPFRLSCRPSRRVRGRAKCRLYCSVRKISSSGDRASRTFGDMSRGRCQTPRKSRPEALDPGRGVTLSAQVTGVTHDFTAYIERLAVQPALRDEAQTPSTTSTLLIEVLWRMAFALA